MLLHLLLQLLHYFSLTDFETALATVTTIVANIFVAVTVVVLAGSVSGVFALALANVITVVVATFVVVTVAVVASAVSGAFALALATVATVVASLF